MSFVAGLLFGLVIPPIIPKSVCEEPSSEEDRGACSWLRMMGLEELWTTETVAVGVGKEIEAMRSKARECGLTHRIDYVGTRVAVLDIFNASEQGRTCIRTWVEEKRPELRFSDERLNARLREPRKPNE